MGLAKIDVFVISRRCYAGVPGRHRTRGQRVRPSGWLWRGKRWSSVPETRRGPPTRAELRKLAPQAKIEGAANADAAGSADVGLLDLSLRRPAADAGAVGGSLGWQDRRQRHCSHDLPTGPGRQRRRGRSRFGRPGGPRASTGLAGRRRVSDGQRGRPAGPRQDAWKGT